MMAQVLTDREKPDPRGGTTDRFKTARQEPKWKCEPECQHPFPSEEGFRKPDRNTEKKIQRVFPTKGLVPAVDGRASVC